jgi:regulator of sirC expression with transglutaminase-like and TPR domain
MQFKEELLPSPASMSAVVRLLADPDAKVYAACRERMLAWGELARKALLEAAENADERVRWRARELLRAVDLQVWQRRMVAAVDRLGAADQGAAAGRYELLEQAVLAAAALERPGQVDEKAFHDQLDRAAEVLRAQLREKTSAARSLTETLGGRLQLAGDLRRTFGIEAVHADQVLARRRGCAVTLALLYLLVARRAGIEAGGVMLPGHFLVRVRGRRSALLDPHFGGRSVTRADCVRHLHKAGHRGSTIAMLADRSDLTALARLIEELRRVYSYREDVAVIHAIERVAAALPPIR